MKKRIPRRCARWSRGAALGAVLLLAACSAPSRAGHGNPYRVPDWIDQPPHDADYVYGVGTYFGALYPEDNRKYATDRAVGELASFLRSDVHRETLILSDDRGSVSRGKTRLLAAGDVRGVEFVTMWTDQLGLRGSRGQEWVLVRARRI